jgi:hypothetical protein
MGYPFVMSLCLALLSARSSPPAAEIKVDQVGYPPQGPKLAMVVSDARPFTVRDEAGRRSFSAHWYRPRTAWPSPWPTRCCLRGAAKASLAWAKLEFFHLPLAMLNS